MLAVIPARGGSKGIPRKNARPFLGKPLVLWAVEAARNSGAFEHVVVSTEDEEIAGIARAAGADVLERPAELAGDEIGTAPVLRHALDALGGELVFAVEPTSPARRPFHLREAAELLRGSDADSIASVSEIPHHFVPEKALRLGDDGTLAGADGAPVASMTHRRQELEPRYAFDGIVFGCRAELLRRDPPTIWGERVLGYLVEPRYATDLDRPEDWPLAEARVKSLSPDGPSNSLLLGSGGAGE